MGSVYKTNKSHREPWSNRGCSIEVLTEVYWFCGTINNICSEEEQTSAVEQPKQVEMEHELVDEAIEEVPY